MTGGNELDDRELVAFAKQHRTPQWAMDIIRQRFALVGEGEDGEHFECRYCRRWFAVAEVMTCVDPRVLLEHSVPGLPVVRARYGTGRFWHNQCALEDDAPSTRET